MKYNSIIEYIKETYPYIITYINDENESFIIKNMFIVGLFKNNQIYKIDIPFHIGIDNISKCSGFNDSDHDDLLNIVDNSDLIIKEYNLQPLQYQIFYDKSSNIFIPIKNDYLYKIPKIIKRYEIYLDKIKTCQIKIIEDKKNIIKDLHQYKNDIINYIIDNKLESQDINKLYKTVQDENVYYKDKLHSLYKCNVNPQIDELQLKEFIYELHTELIHLQNDLNKSQFKIALLERYKNESRNTILSEKESIIKSIKKYHYNWLEWLESIDFSNTNDIDNYKYILLKQLKIIENKFKDLLKSHNLEEININSSLSREDFKKLKQNITDIQSEITNVIQDELIQLSIKDSNYNYNKELSNYFLIDTNDNNDDRWPDEFYYIKDDLNEINSLLLQNKNTKIEILKQFINISDCYLIIQNFLTLNNIFYRTQTILKKLGNIIYNNLPPFRYLSEDIQKKLLADFDLLKLEINNNIDFLNLNSYINDVNLKRFKTKSGIENYYKNRSKDENDFCIHLFNIIKFWNLNKKYYTNINTRLTNIYEDISGHIQIYIRVKPYSQNNIQIENRDNNSNINNLINTNIYTDKKQFCISISSEKETRIFNDFYGIFDESYTNFNLYTGNKKETEIINELKQEVSTEKYDELNEGDYDRLEEINYGLYKTFINLENGYSSVLISYGNSYSGKTFSLFGDQNTNGILYYGLKNLKNVSNISLDYVFEQYYNNNNLTNNKISGNIHNLINNINLQNLEISNTNIYIDETNEFSKRLPSYIDINDINIDNIDSLFNIIDNYRKYKGRICKTPNNTNANRSHLYMIFKISFNEKQERYLTIIDTASQESPHDLFNYFINKDTQTKLQLIMAPQPIGGIQKIKKTINPSIIDDYSPSDILKILNESFYINETINHLTYFLNKSKRLTEDDHQTSIDKYNISKFFISPINEMYAINDSNCLTIPILNFINNLQTTTKYTILCCINQEKIYYDQTIATLEFADKIKKI